MRWYQTATLIFGLIVLLDVLLMSWWIVAHSRAAKRREVNRRDNERWHGADSVQEPLLDDQADVGHA